MDSENNGKKKNAVTEKFRSLNRNTLGVIISAAVIILVLVIWLLARGGGTGDNKNAEPKENTPEAYAQIGDSNLGTIKTDAEEGDAWEVLNDEEYNIQIDALSDGYSGPFVEDGSDEKVKDVLALQFTNKGEQDIQYAEYVFSIGKKAVSFKLSDLPAGQSCVVLETTQHKYKEKDKLEMVSRVVALVDEIPFARDQILTVDNSDDTITIMNLTDKEIPVARVFYKSFDNENNLFVGGITYNAKAEKIPAGGGITVAPSHFKSGESVVVGTGVYESDS